MKPAFAEANGVFIPVFTNFTDEVGAERVFTNALIRELQSRGELLTTDKENSDIEILGEVLQITYSPSVYSDNGFRGLQSYRRLPSELGVTVLLALRVVDLKQKKVLWVKQFSGFRRVGILVSRTYDYEAPSSVGLQTQSLVASSYPDIARDIMRDVYDEIVQIF